MRPVLILSLAVCFAISARLATPQNPSKTAGRTSGSTQDRPVSGNSLEELRKLEEAIRPFVEKAKRSYPQVKKRFLAGLPLKHVLFITTRIRDEQGRSEQVFVAVGEIKKGTIKGVISSDTLLVTKYKVGDIYSFPESELVDWTITRPDGSEEGNFVGKFLDTYQKD